MVKVRNVFEQGFRFGSIVFDTTTFESNMPYGLRFMIDTGIFGVSWIELKKDTYALRSKKNYYSQCQIEVDIHNYNDIEWHPSSGVYASIAPVRILSFDIECASERGTFPKAEKDPVIQIANIVKIHGQEHPFVRNVCNNFLVFILIILFNFHYESFSIFIDILINSIILILSEIYSSISIRIIFTIINI